MNTNKNNILLAEFMGIDQVDIDTYQETNSNLKYHISWDWLIPVVQKIEQDCEGVPQEMLNISLYSDINEVYRAVIEFIKEYNKNK